MVYCSDGLPAAIASRSRNRTARVKSGGVRALTSAVSIALRRDSGMLVVKTVYPGRCPKDRNLFAEMARAFPFQRETTKTIFCSKTFCLDRQASRKGNG